MLDHLPTGLPCEFTWQRTHYKYHTVYILVTVPVFCIVLSYSVYCIYIVTSDVSGKMRLALHIE